MKEFGSSLPMRATKQSCGLDLSVSQSGKVMPGDRILVSTGISIQLPKGTYGKISSRSSMALKGIDIGGGIIDSDYRGIIKLILINNGKKEFNFSAGERLAQMIISDYRRLKPKVVTNLNETSRQAAGFGSTGFKAF